MEHLLWPFINLIILTSILGIKLKKPLGEFVRNRHTTLRDELRNVDETLRQAKHKHEEFSAKLKAIGAEISALKEQVKQDSESMKLRVVTDAKRLAGLVVSDAQGAAQGLYGELRNNLKTEFGIRVIDRAEQLLRERLTGDDRVRIRREFSRQMESMQ
jgi:F0F1-type ATP synthase membrane subunit b/b'